MCQTLLREVASFKCEVLEMKEEVKSQRLVLNEIYQLLTEKIEPIQDLPIELNLQTKEDLEKIEAMLMEEPQLEKNW